MRQLSCGKHIVGVVLRREAGNLWMDGERLEWLHVSRRGSQSPVTVIEQRNHQMVPRPNQRRLRHIEELKLVVT